MMPHARNGPRWPMHWSRLADEAAKTERQRAKREAARPETPGAAGAPGFAFCRLAAPLSSFTNGAATMT